MKILSTSYPLPNMQFWKIFNDRKRELLIENSNQTHAFRDALDINLNSLYFCIIGWCPHINNSACVNFLLFFHNNQMPSAVSCTFNCILYLTTH